MTFFSPAPYPFDRLIQHVSADEDNSAGQPEQPHEVEQHYSGFFRIEDQDQSKYYRKEAAQQSDPKTDTSTLGMIFLFFPGLNRLPVIIADSIGGLCFKYRIISVIYIIIIFFLLPFAFIYMTK